MKALSLLSLVVLFGICISISVFASASSYKSKVQDNCANDLMELQPVCKGGILFSTVEDNCRVERCVKGIEQMTVRICAGSTQESPEYFQMFREFKVGRNLKMCVGKTCMKNQVYMTGKFPVCRR